MGLLRFLARTMFAWIFLAMGVKTATEPGRRPDLVAKTLPLPRPDLMVRLNGGLMVAGGAALALGIKPRLAALELAATLVPTTYVGHQFWNQAEPAARASQLIHFDKNLAIIGGLLTYALTPEK
ncbi:MAG: DoxX family protein [Candidatus Dormibacteraeota bacterium]|uniref:DoxX family protein n=1 Tax=Candidatus Aeolococcus gillhamiae TaxID=3127015 RepID=A0A2W5ZHE6_9BACT|nr:DoxX family protein [Candidatus Dormibacteraeota bacterium]PZR82226.1 MAG: DoxX family protein [Candidatus Dormibacter sp. RRmetagenome_bin12]